MLEESKYEEDHLTNYPLDRLDFQEVKDDKHVMPWGMELKQYCLLMHLAQFAGFMVPFAGLILPIVMWSTNKEKHRLIDQNGKQIVNWIISSTIYIFASFILMFFIIGFFTIFAVVICSLIFPIIGAVKANDGEVWKYPLTIKFIK